MLVLHLRIGRVVNPEIRHGRPEHRLLNIGRHMRVLGSSQNGSLLATDGIAVQLRPSPVFRYSLLTFGWMKYFRKSFATSTFFAPLGIRAQPLSALLGTGLPSLPSAKPMVRILS